MEEQIESGWRGSGSIFNEGVVEAPMANRPKAGEEQAWGYLFDSNFVTREDITTLTQSRQWSTRQCPRP